MTQRADIGSRRLISLAPTAWVRWLLGDETLDAIDLLAADFQWVSRESDALIRVHSPTHGDFVVVNEIQLRYDPHMPSRMWAYAALAHERYRQPVYPVLVNILPPPAGVDIPTRFEYQFLGLRAWLDYRVINLWEVEAEGVLEAELLPLLPFVPMLRGGQAVPLVQQAVTRLRADPELSELEPLLAFFASFVLETELVQQIMRWDMTVLRESPWYQEILEEGWERGLKEEWERGLEEGRERGLEEGRERGLEEGRERGLEEGRERGLEEGRERGLEEGRERGLEEGRREDLLWVLGHRFDEVPAEVEEELERLDLEQLERLFIIALDAPTLDEFRAHLPPASTESNGDRDPGPPV